MKIQDKMRHDKRRHNKARFRFSEFGLSCAFVCVGSIDMSSRIDAQRAKAVRLAKKKYMRPKPTNINIFGMYETYLMASAVIGFIW
jgi:hypothetical protein